MGDAVGKGFEFLDRFTQFGGALVDPAREVVIGGLKFLLVEFAFGNIAGNLGVAAQVAVFVANGAHSATDEKALSIFAEMPALIHGGTLRGGGEHLLPRHVAFAVLRGEKNGGVLPENLGRRVTEEVLGAWVPLLNQPSLVGGDNGEI